MSNFNLHVLDNFLPQNCYKDVLDQIPNIDWGAKTLTYKTTTEGVADEHRWFSSHIDPDSDIAITIEKCILEKTKFNFRSFRLLAFTMVPKMEPFPHVDLDGDGTGHTNQLILYIDGNTEMNKGTGFYVQENEKTINLNTHVGFHKNRAILFESGMYHSPLLFLSDDSIPRISIIARF
jgi:hypothetical protein|tara:strand:- start:362 stop:895 length:534 start_codon:yes stop_codon:yes gene_type:complete